MSDNPLINIGELSRPATVLIQKISAAVGGVFKPYQIVRVAKAEAEANRISAESQIEISDLQRRAMHRFLVEEAKKQSNIESITQQALPLLTDGSSPEAVDDDWITNFFDKSRIVSDENMQRLWSHILANEANRPGSFSKKTVNLMADLEKADAQLFKQLCAFSWIIGGEAFPLIFNVQSEIHSRNGVTFSTISHLESLGLVQFNHLSGFIRQRLPKVVSVSYFGRQVDLTFQNDGIENELQLGHVLLTKPGRELLRISEPAPVDDFFDIIYSRWQGEGIVPAPDITRQVPIEMPIVVIPS